MDIVTPGVGLVFWTVLTFIIVLLILRAYAWKPIMNALHIREHSIEEALRSAEQARIEMENLQASHGEMIKEAQQERDRVLAEARQSSTEMIEKAKADAQAEAEKVMASGRAAIESEKQAAITELKNKVAEISVQMAEMLLKKELSDQGAQKALVERYVNETKFN